MNKSYISPTKLSCLALCCMISTLTMGFNALILCVCASATFVFGIAIVSNLEKITSNHVRFIIYTLIISAIFTVVKVVFGYINSIKLLEIAEGLDYAYLASITLSILPIYFMHKESTNQYYNKTVLTAILFALGGVFVSVVVELINSGSIFGLNLFNMEASVLGSPFVSFALIALISVAGTFMENYIENKKRQERLVIDRYKLMIRDYQLRKIKQQAIQNNIANDKVSEGGNE